VASVVVEMGKLFLGSTLIRHFSGASNGVGQKLEKSSFSLKISKYLYSYFA
jgi:hypothetical protein